MFVVHGNIILHNSKGSVWMENTESTLKLDGFDTAAKGNDTKWMDWIKYARHYLSSSFVCRTLAVNDSMGSYSSYNMNKSDTLSFRLPSFAQRIVCSIRIHSSVITFIFPLFYNSRSYIYLFMLFNCNTFKLNVFALLTTAIPWYLTCN